MARRWTEAEDDAIRRYYPTVGPRWNGWAKLMPDRMPSHDVLAHRACRIGVRCESGFRYGRGKRAAEEAAWNTLTEELGNGD